jgi:anti-sigma factor RsiW
MHGYLDGELDPSVSLQYERHVGECAACSKALAEQQELRARLRGVPLYYKAPDALRERVRLTLRERHGGRLARIARRWVAVAACAALLIGFGFVLARFAFSSTGNDRLPQEVASAHIRSLQEEHLVDVRSSDKHRVKPWFNGKLDFAPPTPDLKAYGFPLVGGRLDYLDGRAVAALVYSRRAHFINLFVWPSSGTESGDVRQETRQGYHVFHWSKAGMNYWLVSDLDPAELHEMVQRLRE